MDKVLKIGFPHNVIYRGTNFEFMDASKGYGDDWTAEIGLSVEERLSQIREYERERH